MHAHTQELGLGSQEEVPPINGFSIQCRVTSEDAAQNFQVCFEMQEAPVA